MYRPQSFKVLIICCKKNSDEFEFNEIEQVKFINKTYELDLKQFDFHLKDPIEYDCAIVLNSCDKGYGIFTMDDSSVYFFEKYMS